MTETFEDGGTEVGPDDPAAAFMALRRSVEITARHLGSEMTVIRKGVEAAFDGFEKAGTPVDYGADLGRIVQSLAAMDDRLQAIERSPVLRQGAEHYARTLEGAGTRLMREAVQGLERQAVDLERAGRSLAAHTKSAHDRKSQDVRMATAAGFGVIAGAFLLLLLPRFLPFAADSRVAALVMGLDRVSAGRAMIRTADPDASRGLATAEWVYDTNHAGLDSCIAAMFQTRKEQRCAVVLPVVEAGASR